MELDNALSSLLNLLWEFIYTCIRMHVLKHTLGQNACWLHYIINALGTFYKPGTSLLPSQRNFASSRKKRRNTLTLHNLKNVIDNNLTKGMVSFQSQFKRFPLWKKTLEENSRVDKEDNMNDPLASPVGPCVVFWTEIEMTAGLLRMYSMLVRFFLYFLPLHCTVGLLHSTSTETGLDIGKPWQENTTFSIMITLLGLLRCILKWHLDVFITNTPQRPLLRFRSCLPLTVQPVESALCNTENVSIPPPNPARWISIVDMAANLCLCFFLLSIPNVCNGFPCAYFIAKAAWQFGLRLFCCSSFWVTNLVMVTALITVTPLYLVFSPATAPY